MLALPVNGDAPEVSNHAKRSLKHEFKVQIMNEQQMRTESDSMGELEVPVYAYYGANTQRARLNFPISELRFNRSFIRTIGQIKLSAATVNRDLGELPPDIAIPIEKAAARVIDGDFDSGVAYTGAGTGLISEILTVQEVFKDLVDGSHSLARKLV